MVPFESHAAAALDLDTDADDSEGQGRARWPHEQVPGRGPAFRRAGLLVGLLLLLVATTRCLLQGAGRDGTSTARTTAEALSHSALQDFKVLDAYRTIMHCNPFQFHCPLPLFKSTALNGVDRPTALRSCCHDYDRMAFQWPYQFPECGQQSNCSSCWLQSGEPDLARHPVAGLAAVGYATSMAVSGPKKLAPSDLEPSRRLEAADNTRHAGLASNQILAPMHYGVRAHDANLCPLVNDWEEYYLTHEEDNIHARVYKSTSAQLAVIAFRGTQLGSLKNWATDANINARLLRLDKSGHGTFVHEGYYKALKDVLPHVRKWVEGYIEGVHGMWQVPPTWKLLFTGHSLGGALATLAATVAELEGWARKPDAVVTYGAPRLADGNLSRWWQARGLCDRLLRINVYNDMIHWMPFTMGFDLLDDFFECARSPMGCIGRLQTGLQDNARQLKFSQRWAHVCPKSEFMVPGAMKGVNAELKDFSPLGGILAHFLGNGLFGYGFGIQYSGVLVHDAYCGMTPAVFPRFHCSTVEDLSGVRCMGLKEDKGAEDEEACRKRCCDDPYCEVWQLMKDGACWRGRSHTCSPPKLLEQPALVGQRVH